MKNSILHAIRNRRSIVRFESTAIGEEKIQAILEAGQWAPSWLNKQPWRFTVVTDSITKQNLANLAPTAFTIGLREAPLCIVVSVDPNEDPFHFVEAGAIATQNMALAAHSIGLGSCWIGIFDLEKKKGSYEEKIKSQLDIPKDHRVISLLPVGIPKFSEEKTRKDISNITYRNKFGSRMDTPKK